MYQLWLPAFAPFADTNLGTATSALVVTPISLPGLRTPAVPFDIRRHILSRSTSRECGMGTKSQWKEVDALWPVHLPAG